MGDPNFKNSRRWRRRLFQFAIVLLAGTGFAVVAPTLVGWIIGHKLKTELASRLGAQLEFSRVVYCYPYGVGIEHAHLCLPGTRHGHDTWIDVDGLDLSLAKLPLGVGPLLIDKLNIKSPTLHLASDFGGPGPAPSAHVSPATTAAPLKLSDLFQLRNVTISDGRFEYDFSKANQDRPPIVWGHLNTAMSTTPTAPGKYQFNVMISDAPLASASVSGSFDIDALQLDVENSSLLINCDYSRPAEQIPPEVFDIIQKYRITGQLSVDGTARVPLLNPDHGWYAVKLNLHGGQGQPAGWSAPIKPVELSIIAGNIPDAMSNVLPRDLPPTLPKQPADIHIMLDGFSALAGNQSLKIQSGMADYSIIHHTWIARKIRGNLDIGDGPGPLQGLNTRIILPFFASGNGMAGDPTSALRIALDDGAAVVTPNHIHINRINGLLTVCTTGVRSSGITATCADGQARATVNLSWKNPPQDPPVAITYDGDAEVKQLDLHQLALQYTIDPAVRQQAFGKLDLNLKVDGSILRHSPSTGKNSPADRLTAQGDLDITHGYFLDIPVLRDLLMAMHNPSGSTVGEAAATFNIAHSIVNLDHTGASSPAMGIQGSGTLGFDQQVNMIFVATPLADWAKDVKNAGLLGEAGAAIIGHVQDAVNTVQRSLYQFRVTGNVSKPDVAAVPIPALSDKLAPLFQKMAGNQSNGSVADELKKQKEQDAK